ncbi:MAG: hypothetical protein F6K65_16500 [Moorea sp. SIO3C2]|nr:hypothetical protein [Moorena sp. SIO3C2]
MGGGYPVLVSLGVYHLSRQRDNIKGVLASSTYTRRCAPIEIYSHHLGGLLVMLTDLSQLGSGLKQVVRNNQGVSIEGITGYQQVRPVAN